MSLSLFQLYKEAEELCRQAYGEYHHLMARIKFNTGVCYEDAEQFDIAYDYFKLHLAVALEVYGKDHMRTKRTLKILSEPWYADIARQKEDVIPTPE